MSPAKLAAYHATDYVFPPDPAAGLDAPLVLRIGSASDTLHALYAIHGVSTATCITAFNPRGMPHPADLNAANQHALEGLLRSLGVILLAGEGRAQAGDWPAEPCWLALGIAEPQAQALGLHFEQDAILWIAADAVPALRVLR